LFTKFVFRLFYHFFKNNSTMKQTLFILSVLFMFSCGGQPEKKEVKEVAAPVPGVLPVPAQQVFSLSMIANLPASLCWPHTPGMDAVTAANNIIQYISPIMDSVLQYATDSSNDPVLTLNNWKRVWGPAVMTIHGDSALIDKSDSIAFVPLSSMTIFSDGNTPANYVVAIEATNPNCPYDWDSLDLNVIDMEPFMINGTQYPGYLSKGTSLGVNTYLTQLTSQGVTASQYLNSVSSNINSVIVTGHSLGGALSPVYSLFLKQTLNLKNIYCLSTAGPSPGDTSFISYFNSQMGSNAFRVWNSLDVVPRAWEPDTLDGIVGIYANPSTSIYYDPQYVCSSAIDTLPQTAFTGIQTPGDIAYAVKKISGILRDRSISVVVKNPFTHKYDTTYNGSKFYFGSICNGGTTFTGATANALYFDTNPFNSSNLLIQTYPKDTAFVSQLANQHVAAYSLYYKNKGIHEYARKRVQNSPYSVANWPCNNGKYSAVSSNTHASPDFRSLWVLIHKNAWYW
jgi:hypothetical protein